MTRQAERASLFLALHRGESPLLLPNRGTPVSELGASGVSRVSTGGAFAFAALGAVVQAAEEPQGEGTYGFLKGALVGALAARSAFNG
jgi:hypothetical protein